MVKVLFKGLAVSARRRMLSGKSFVISVLLITAAQVLADQKLTDEGKSRYVVALCDDSTPAEAMAARQLSAYIEDVSGVKLEVLGESMIGASTPKIWVGAGNTVKGLLPDIDWDKLGQDGIVVKSVGNDLVLAGGRPRGTLYAVNTFLEDVLGVRWWAPGASTVPKKENIILPNLDITYVPPFNTREVASVDVERDPYFAMRMKVNGHFQKQDEELGGHNSILGFCHTFFTLLPPSQYFSEHPEWYTNASDGNKPYTTSKGVPLPSANNSQLCLSNDEARAELTKNALSLIGTNPEAGTISVSQMDNPISCGCPKCEKTSQQEGSPSGTLLKFVNKVADVIAREYPTFNVETLAYMQTRKPPLQERPRDNVVIRLCMDGANITHPIDSEINARNRDNVLEWRAIAKKLYIWNYLASFRNLIFPLPNLYVIAPDIRFFRDNNVSDLFEQSDAHSNGAGDFVQLRAWVISRLMWNPDLDGNKLRDEFLDGYYGAAAPYLREYIQLLESSLVQSSSKMDMDVVDFKSYDYLSVEVMNKASELFAKAAEAVKNAPDFSERVRRARLPLDHAWLLRYEQLKEQAKVRNVKFGGPLDPLSYFDDFADTCKKFGVSRYAENDNIGPYLARMRARFDAPPLHDSVRKKLRTSKAGSDVVNVASNYFLLYKEGDWVSLVDDELSSDGSAARLSNDSVEWAIQYPALEGQAEDDSLWRYYVVARVEADGKVGSDEPVMSCGIFSKKRKQGGLPQVKFGQLKTDSYSVIDLGVHPRMLGDIVWIASAKNPNVKNLFIDRIVLIRE